MKENWIARIATFYSNFWIIIKNHATNQRYIFWAMNRTMLLIYFKFQLLKGQCHIICQLWFSLIPFHFSLCMVNLKYTSVWSSINQHHTSEFQIRGKLVFHKTRICKQIVLSWKIWTNLPWNAFSKNNQILLLFKSLSDVNVDKYKLKCTEWNNKCAILDSHPAITPA